ncbi:MAG: hypothetical protein M5U25_21095 [Planctomycetota bacterium]|nr:hypothetical protein [Planctomycetota bacterium]
MDPRPMLIPVFKVSNPNLKLYADQKQINAIMENTHRTSTDVEVIKSRLHGGDQRMERIEASVDDLRQDMRTLKRRATDKA